MLSREKAVGILPTKLNTARRKSDIGLMIPSHGAPKFRGNKLETRVAQEIIWRNIPYTKHPPLFGQPDGLVANRICLFVDGDIFHAHPNRFKPGDMLPTINKRIAMDVWEKDERVNQRLRSEGFDVMRIWEYDLRTDIDHCIDLVEMAYHDSIDRNPTLYP